MRVARAPVRRGRLEHGYHSAYRVYCSLSTAALFTYAYGKNGRGFRVIELAFIIEYTKAGGKTNNMSWLAFLAGKSSRAI